MIFSGWITKVEIFIGYVVAIYMMFFLQTLKNFELLFLLPFLFATIQAFRVIANRKSDDNIMLIVLSFIGIIRYVISPFFYQLSGGVSKITNVSVYTHGNEAILIQCYEMLAIWSVSFFYLYSHRKRIVLTLGDFQLRRTKERFLIYKKALVESILIYGTIFLICILMYPSLIDDYHFIWNIIDTMKKTTSNNVPSIFYAISQLSFNGLRVSFVLLALYNIDNFIIRDNKKFIYLLITILVSLFIVSNDRAFSFFGGIVVLIAAYVYYPNYRRKIISCFVVVGLLAGGALLFISLNSYMASSNVIELLSQTFQSYFQGTSNISVALSMDSINVDRIIGDIGKSIKGVAYFFKDIEDISEIFNRYYYFNSQRSGQIIPFVGQGYYYFGFVLSPCLSCLITWSAFKSYEEIRLYNTLVGVYIQCFKSFICVVSLLMYNFSIYISVYTSLVIPLIIIYTYSSVRKKLRWGIFKI